MGILDSIKEGVESVNEGIQDLKNAAEEVKRQKQEIWITTGNISVEYEVIECVFAMDSHQEGFFESGADIGKAFSDLRWQLRGNCWSAGGNAVINCQFEQKTFSSESLFGDAKAGIQLFAYGTAVRYVSANWLRMGISYEKGTNGLQQDSSQAVFCYSKAAEAGNAQSMMKIAEICDSNGDQPAALKWYQEAIVHGHVEATKKFGYQLKEENELNDNA